MSNLEKLSIPTQEDIVQRDEMLTNLYHENFCGTAGCRLCLSQAQSAPKDANPHCSTCKGSGWLYDTHNGITPGSKVIRCPDCKDLNKRVHTEKANPYTFDKFFDTRLGKKEPQLVKAKDKIIEFTALKSKPFMLMYGGTGVGKSYLSKICEHSLKEIGHNVVRMVCSELLDWLRKGFEDKQYPTDERIEFLKDAFVLIIDDFKVEYTSDWGFDRLEMLLDFRYETFRPTLLITNNDITQLPFRLQDRFKDKAVSEIIKIDLPSYRGLKK